MHLLSKFQQYLFKQNWFGVWVKSWSQKGYFPQGYYYFIAHCLLQCTWRFMSEMFILLERVVGTRLLLVLVFLAFDYGKFIYLLSVLEQTGLSKQCKPWSDATECSIWSGATLVCLSSRGGLGGSVGCAVRLETRRSRVQPPPRLATFFRGDWSWSIFYGHSLPSADSRRAVVSFWWKNAHNTG